MFVVPGKLCLTPEKDVAVAEFYVFAVLLFLIPGYLRYPVGRYFRKSKMEAHT